MIGEIFTGAAALIAAVGGVYSFVKSRTMREATTRRTANEAADFITEAAGKFVKEVQEASERTAKRNRELVDAINALTDLLDELLEHASRDGTLLGKPGASCDDRKADTEFLSKLREANRKAKIAT